MRSSAHMSDLDLTDVASTEASRVEARREIDDMAIDTLDTILDVAVEVVSECAPAPGNTRLERMARYLVSKLGGAPYGLTTAGSIAKFSIPGEVPVYQTYITKDVTVIRIGGLLGIELEGRKAQPLTTAQGNALVIAMLRAVEKAEGDVVDEPLQRDAPTVATAEP